MRKSSLQYEYKPRMITTTIETRTLRKYLLVLSTRAYLKILTLNLRVYVYVRTSVPRKKCNNNLTLAPHIVRREERLSTSEYRHASTTIPAVLILTVSPVLGEDSWSKRSKKPKEKYICGDSIKYSRRLKECCQIQMLFQLAYRALCCAVLLQYPAAFSKSHRLYFRFLDVACFLSTSSCILFLAMS